MAVGWKSLTGIVGAASIVSVGTLYSVLVREPAGPTQPAPQVKTEPTAPAASHPSAAQTPFAAPPAPQTSQESPKNAPPAAPVQQQAAAEPEAPGPQPAKPKAGKPDAPQPAASAEPPSGSATQGPQTVATPDLAKADVAKPDNAKPDNAKPDNAAPTATTAQAREQALPSFDIARVEAGGDAVIAGRSAPSATVELLRNGNSYARAVADVSGQWAIVPPTLPKGTCELTLRSITPDGRVAQSQQTVSVRVPERADEEVVVVLNTPDQPSKVLTDAAPRPTKPVPNPQVAAAQPTQGIPADGSAPVATPSPSAPTPTTPKADAAKTPTRANAAIRTVEADERGRFFVTGMAEPGAALRIYLNDTMVTAVTAAKDGSFGMTIEKGMAPGDYKVRVDDVAPGTGQVLTRAEVPFAMAEKTPASSAPTVVTAASSPGKSAFPGATAPASGSVPIAASGSAGSATPAATHPASIEAPGAVATSGSAPTSRDAAPAAAGSVQTATASTPSQGASPASTPSVEAGSRASPTTTPDSAGQTTPGNQSVEVGEAKPAAAAAPPSMAVIPEIRTTTIVQGDNLWRLSRKIYGQGIRYTWIYDANTDQIRNPNLIYPGQIFVMPEKKTQ